MKKEEIMEFLKAHKDEMARRFGVRRIGLFGSHARGEATTRSDLDILVEMEQPGFDNYMDLKFYLEENLGMTVDLVLADSLKPRLKPIITREAAYA